jgi:hypothetical protein
MGFYLRKSLRVGPLRFNLSKSGIGVSAGIKGFRVGSGPRGNYVNMGRGGLYHRATLPEGTHVSAVSHPSSQPAEPSGVLTEIESGSVMQMAPASAADLLNEIRAKHRRITFWPLVLVLGCAALWIAEPHVPIWVSVVGFLALLGATVSVMWRDAIRKTVVLFYGWTPTRRRPIRLSTTASPGSPAAGRSGTSRLRAQQQTGSGPLARQRWRGGE